MNAPRPTHAPDASLAPWASPAKAIDALFEQMIEQQRHKTLEIARAKVPYLTPDDILTPEAYPSIHDDGPFNYEDGILNGLLSAQMAVRAWFREAERGPATPGSAPRP